MDGVMWMLVYTGAASVDGVMWMLVGGRGGVEEEFTLYRFTETKLCMLVQGVVPTLEWLSQDL